MPMVKINGFNMNYRLEGEGDKTLVILNGIMMSADSWAGLVPSFVRNGYRVLTLDFRDQGKSQPSPEAYKIGQHAEDLKALLELLEIKCCSLLGISYGGQVAMLFALKYPQLLESLILANTMARMSNHLKAIGAAWDEAAKLKDGKSFLRLAMPIIYSQCFYSRSYEWLQAREEALGGSLTSEWFEAFQRLSSSHGDYDLVEELEKIKLPTLIIASDQDTITPYEEQLLIHRKVKASSFVVIPESGHASCYEKPQEFILLVLGFLAALSNRHE